MEKKIWRKYPDECACCGYSRIEVYTDSEAKEGWVWDGDPIKCKSCPATGTMSVHDEDDVGISWDEDTFTEEVQDEYKQMQFMHVSGAKMSEQSEWGSMGKDYTNDKIYIIECMCPSDHIYCSPKSHSDLIKYLKKQEAELAVCVEALEFYADIENYDIEILEDNNACIVEINTKDIMSKCAKETLAKVRGGKK